MTYILGVHQDGTFIYRKLDGEKEYENLNGGVWYKTYISTEFSMPSWITVAHECANVEEMLEHLGTQPQLHLLYQALLRTI